jgi:hypothetical protein
MQAFFSVLFLYTNVTCRYIYLRTYLTDLGFQSDEHAATCSLVKPLTLLALRNARFTMKSLLAKGGFFISKVYRHDSASRNASQLTLRCVAT